MLHLKELKYFFEVTFTFLTTQTLNSNMREEQQLPVMSFCTRSVLLILFLHIDLHNVGMPSIEWKWSEWIPLAELDALVAHTVGQSATETEQPCTPPHCANQASHWHSLDIAQKR